VSWHEYGGNPLRSWHHYAERWTDCSRISSVGGHGASGNRERWLGPAVEVVDTKDAVVVKAQVPDISKEQPQVTVTDDALTLKGEVKEEEKKEDKNYYRRELRYGSFSHTIPLPAAVRVDKASAQLSMNGANIRCNTYLRDCYLHPVFHT
jgi:HSP20 family molecular chaperone IbpA